MPCEHLRNHFVLCLFLTTSAFPAGFFLCQQRTMEEKIGYSRLEIVLAWDLTVESRYSASLNPGVAPLEKKEKRGAIRSAFNRTRNPGGRGRYTWLPLKDADDEDGQPKENLLCAPDNEKSITTGFPAGSLPNAGRERKKRNGCCACISEIFTVLPGDHLACFATFASPFSLFCSLLFEVNTCRKHGNAG